MLDLEKIDLVDLAVALEDHSHKHGWWFDPATGAVTPQSREPFELPEPRDGSALLPVHPLSPSVGYGDMEDFAGLVREPRARSALKNAIVGRGAFRRFKDALLEFPALRRAWFAFHDNRAERRALEWLAAHEVVDPAQAGPEIVRRADPAPIDLPGLIDGEGIARRTARDLQRLYRERLRGVLLVGEWARTSGHSESPVELVVTLDEVRDRWAEKRRMEQVMWRHSIRNHAVVTQVPVTEEELARGATPLLARARADGVRIA